MEGNFTPFPLYKYNYLMMDHESLHKIKTTRKPESRQIDLNECFFHGRFESSEEEKQFTGGRSWMLPLRSWLRGYRTASVRHESCNSNHQRMMTERDQFHRGTRSSSKHSARVQLWSRQLWSGRRPAIRMSTKDLSFDYARFIHTNVPYNIMPI